MPGSNLASERGQALVWPPWAALCRRKRSHGVALVRGNPLKLRGFDLTPEEPHPSCSVKNASAIRPTVPSGEDDQRERAGDLGPLLLHLRDRQQACLPAVG